MIPDRVAELVARLEAGEPLTQADVDRASTLVALDLVVAGRRFVDDAFAAMGDADGVFDAKQRTGS